jgi:coenzyme F420-reducing hydrogenase gamma subunit
MGRKSRKKKERKRRSHDKIKKPVAAISWQDAGGVHIVMPGLPPSPEQVAEMTTAYQKNIRQSPLWDYMVNEFGLEKAEELLKECQVKLKPT